MLCDTIRWRRSIRRSSHRSSRSPRKVSEVGTSSAENASSIKRTSGLTTRGTSKTDPADACRRTVPPGMGRFRARSVRSCRSPPPPPPFRLWHARASSPSSTFPAPSATETGRSGNTIPDARHRHGVPADPPIQHLAGAGRGQPTNDPQQRGFTAAGTAQHGHDFAERRLKSMSF